MRTQNTKKYSRLNRTLDLRLKDYSLVAAGALAFAPHADAAIAATSPTLNLSVPVNVNTNLPIPGHPAALIIQDVSAESFNSVAVGSGSGPASVFGNPPTAGSSISPANAGEAVPTGLTAIPGSATLTYQSDSLSWTTFLAAHKYVGFSIGSGSNKRYGWINLSIAPGEGAYVVTVNQIAIEQCAGQPITIGATSGGANCTPATPAPNSLWLMSIGVAGIAGLEALRRLRRAS